MLPSTQWDEHANCNDFNGVEKVGVGEGRGEEKGPQLNLSARLKFKARTR